MLRYIGIFITITALFLGCSVVFATDQNDALSAGVTGEPTSSVEIVIGGGGGGGEEEPLTFEDVGAVVGPYSGSLGGCPFDIQLEDNDVTAVLNDVLFKARIISDIPGQYGEDKTYYITADVEWDPEPDNTVSLGTDGGVLGGSHQPLLYFNGSGPGILHGVMTQDFILYIRENKRLYGDTSDFIIIEYTLSEY